MLLILWVGIVAFYGTPSSAVAQQGTEITATVCAADGPALQITSPISDSVVNTREVALTGTAERTSQIEVYVNGEYIQSTAVGSDNLINSTIPLVLGTNSIKLSAYYSCNQQSFETTLVVTYTPDASSQTGRPSTRTTRPGNTAPLQISNPEDTPVTKPGIVDRIEDKFVFKDNSFVRPIMYFISLFMAVMLLTLALMPKKYWNRLFIKVDPNAKRIKNYRWVRLVLRCIAALIAVIFATIIQA